MKIAISTDDGKVSAHFGRCPAFTIIDIKKGDVKSKKIINNPGHKTGYLPEFLRQYDVECIIAGGMGRKAYALFEEKKIKSIIGVTGDVDKIIDKLINGTLKEGQSLCNPGSGKGYGVSREKTEHDQGH